MGFDTINQIIEKYKIDVTKKKFNGLYGKGMIEGREVLLLKPQTYMNLSGKSIKQFMNFYKLSFKELIVIYDDIDLETGKIRIRRSGSAGTHNGMRSVTEELQTEEFIRVRVGIGAPCYKEDIFNHVIGRVPKEEQETLQKAAKKAAEAVAQILKEGLETTMNLYNG